MNGPATTGRTSPAMPLPPMPRTTTFSMSSWSGRPPTSAAWAAATSICSGSAAAASNRPSESSESSVMSGGERRLDALGGGLGHEPVVLGVVDGLGLVDEHHRDVVADGVATLE